MATSDHENTAEAPEELKLHGLLAEFDNVDDLITSCEKVRDSGYTKWDAHTPFPVHGIESSVGIKDTILPWIVLVGGLVGLTAATLMQWWMNAVDYPYLVSGKPFFSLPADVPIMFELTVLFSAITAFMAVLVLNSLPQLHHHLFRSERFKRATDDRFFISIDANDPIFAIEKAKALLASLSTLEIEDVMDEANPPPFPKAIGYGVVIAVCLSFVPLAFIARARYATNDKPRLASISDIGHMDGQLKFKTQTFNPLFEDGRAMRPQVGGTVSRGEYFALSEMPYHAGKDTKGEWATSFPLPVTDALMERGQERFAIYCAPCHGLTGAGDGIVAKRADRLVAQQLAVWTPPLSLVDPTGAIVTQPVGQIFGTITNGIRTMPSYGAQIPTDDRWAIVLYIRALQKSRSTRYEGLPPEVQAALGGK